MAISVLLPGTIGLLIFLTIWDPSQKIFHWYFQRSQKKSLVTCLCRSTKIYSLWIRPPLLFSLRLNHHISEKKGVIWWQLTTPFSYPSRLSPYARSRSLQSTVEKSDAFIIYFPPFWISRYNITPNHITCHMFKLRPQWLQIPEYKRVVWQITFQMWS